MAVHPYQLAAWIDRCQSSVSKLREDYQKLSKESRLAAGSLFCALLPCNKTKCPRKGAIQD